MSTAERIEQLEERKQALEQMLTGASHGINRPQASKELASVRRQIAMLTEDQRKARPIPQPARRVYL